MKIKCSSCRTSPSVLLCLAFTVSVAVLVSGGSLAGCRVLAVDDGSTPDTDWPTIPQPAAPYQDTAPESDTVTVVQPLTTNYRPIVVRLLCVWDSSSRFRSRSWVMADNDWQEESFPVMQNNPGECWSNAITPLNYSKDPVYCSNPGYGWLNNTVDVSFAEPYGRMLLVEGGVIRPQNLIQVTGIIWGPGPSHMCDKSVGGSNTTHWLELCGPSWLEGAPRDLQELPYLRRDRYWRRLSIANENSDFKVLIGDTDYTLTVSYTSGTSTTETETFGRSVTASAGLDYGALKAGVEVTLSHSFSTSVTIHDETTVQESYNVSGEDGKYVQFQVWEGVEVYTITDAQGDPFTDPNYVFESDELVVHGNGPALVATKFDYP